MTSPLLGDLRSHQPTRMAVVGAGVLITWVLAGAVLPRGLPLGVVVLGVVLGSLTGLTAMGLVLVYRSTRIINFAQAEIGGLASALSVLLVTGKGVPYVIAVPIGLVAALATGALVDITVVRRLFRAPRLIGTVAMVGVAQILGAGQLVLPHLFTSDLAPFTVYRTPFNLSFHVGPILFRGDHVLAVGAALVALGALSWFLGRTDIGIAIRGAAESPDRARLAGIPVRRLSLVTWLVAGGLSGMAALLSTPIVGVSLGSLAGPHTLLVPLAAAVIARMERLSVAVAAAIGISVVQQAAFWSYPSSSYVDVIVLGLIVVALAAQPREFLREGGDLAGSTAVREPSRLALAVRTHARVRAASALGLVTIATLAVVLPLSLDEPDVGLLANIAIFAIMSLSMLVLTGWSGQISLGQFALAGVGAAVVGALISETNVDLFVGLVIAGFVSAAVAVALGLSTARVSGVFLGVVTLAAAAAASSYFLNPAYFDMWTPDRVTRPTLFERVSIDSPRSFYVFCVAVLLLAIASVLGFRRSYVGRAVIAARENERAAAASGLSLTRLKLFTFGFSGFLAAVAGGLYILSLRGFGYQTFNPTESLQVFTMAVVGGLGSIWGALAGAVYVQGVLSFTSGAAELLGTGAGLLFLILIFPGGLAEVGYRLRDVLVARLTGGGDEFADGDALDGAVATNTGESGQGRTREPAPQREVLPGSTALSWSGIEAGYGSVQVLFGSSASLPPEGSLAVVGVNGVGKSTLLLTLAGLVPASAGRVELFDRDVTNASVEARVRDGLVLVVGGAGVFRSLTVDENLRLGSWILRGERASIEDLRSRVLELFPTLHSRGAIRAELLSGGEQQMLALAMGLMARPKVLMVDELSLGLAPVIVESLLKVLGDLRQDGLTLIVVEQSGVTAARVADQVRTMERGRFVRPKRVTGSRRLGVQTGVKTGSRVVQPNGVVDLALSGVTKAYGGVHAVEEIDLEVLRGQFLGIIGANGAGKTTLLDIVSGFIRPDVGEVSLFGRDVTKWPAELRAEQGLSRVFQHARLFPNLTVRETVAVGMSRQAAVREPIAHLFRLPAAVASERRLYRAVDDVLEELGLTRYRDRPTRELSTGTRRAVELACVIANQPDLLLLDEPTAGIAHDETEELAGLLVRLHQSSGATFVMIEHDVDLVSRLAERIICMDQGRIIADGEPGAVLADDAVRAVYFGVGIGDRGDRPLTRRRRVVSVRDKRKGEL